MAKAQTRSSDKKVEDAAGQLLGETSPEDSTEAVTPATTSAVAPPMDTSSGVQGEFDQSDMQAPYLKIIQGSSKLKEIFEEGTVVLNDELVLPPPARVIQGKPTPEPHTLTFIPVVLRKQYRENLDDKAFKEGIMPRIVDTLDEVHACGGTTQWIDNERPSWGAIAHILMLIEKPEECENASFSMELGDKAYATAVYVAGGKAYTSVGKALFNALSTLLTSPEVDAEGNPVKTPSGFVKKRPDISKRRWTMHVIRDSSGNFLTLQPRIKLVTGDEGLTPPEIKEYCEQVREGLSAGVGQ